MLRSLTFSVAPYTLAPMAKPRTQPDRDAARAGARLTDALIHVAGEYARDQGLPDLVVVGALVSALGCVASAVARTNGYDRTRYERLVATHFARVFQAESARPAYTIH